MAKSRAALPLVVKIDVVLACGCAWRSSSAAAVSGTFTSDSTGPKISSRPMDDFGFTLSNTVGPRKKPFSRPLTVWPRPSRRSSAPSATPFSM